MVTSVWDSLCCSWRVHLRFPKVLQGLGPQPVESFILLGNDFIEMIFRITLHFVHVVNQHKCNQKSFNIIKKLKVPLKLSSIMASSPSFWF